jgi:hypothetical protein
MQVFTTQMVQALSDQQYQQVGGSWRLDRDVLPLVIYSERLFSTSQYGVGVVFGGPGQRLGADGADGVLQMGQRYLAGSNSFYYDLSSGEEQSQFENDFIRLTLKVADRFTEPHAVVDALLKREIESSAYRDTEGPAKAALEVAYAYGVQEHVLDDIRGFLHVISRDPVVYEDLAAVARESPDRFPGLPRLMRDIDPPSEARGRIGRWFKR